MLTTIWFPRFCRNILWLQPSYPPPIPGKTPPLRSRSCHGSSMRSWSPRSPSQKDMALCGKVRSRFAWIPWQLGVFLTKKKHQNHQADGGKVCGKFLGGELEPKSQWCQCLWRNFDWRLCLRSSGCCNLQWQMDTQWTWSVIYIPYILL